VKDFVGAVRRPDLGRVQPETKELGKCLSKCNKLTIWIPVEADHRASQLLHYRQGHLFWYSVSVLVDIQ